MQYLFSDSLCQIFLFYNKFCFPFSLPAGPGEHEGSKDLPAPFYCKEQLIHRDCRIFGIIAALAPCGWRKLWIMWITLLIKYGSRLLPGDSLWMLFFANPGRIDFLPDSNSSLSPQEKNQAVGAGILSPGAWFSLNNNTFHAFTPRSGISCPPP